MRRDGSTAADAQARIDAQMPLAAMAARADCVIHNDGTPKELRRQVGT
jgi:dephospho-CoA kinase